MIDLLEILEDAGVGDGIPPETAQEILREAIEEYPRRENQIVEAIHEDYLRYPDIPSEFLSSEVFEALILMGDFDPGLMPKSFETQGTLLARICVDSSHLINVDDKVLTNEFLEELFDCDPNLDKYFDEVVSVYKTYGHRWLNQKLMQWIMDTDPDWIHHNVHTHGKYLVALIDPELRADFFLRYPRQFPGSEYRRDIEAIKGAVVGDFRNIQHVAPEDLTQEICRMALVQSTQAVDLIPFEFLGEDLARVYFQKGGSDWDRFDTETLSYDFWKMVLEQDGNQIRSVPSKTVTEELRILAVRYHPHNMDYIPEDFRSTRICVESYCLSGNRYGIPSRVWNSIEFQVGVINWGNNPSLQEPLPDLEFLKFCSSSELDPLDSFSRWKFNNPSNSKPRKFKVVL